MSGIQLSISILASNRRNAFARCLESIRPLLERLPAELIVVFTGTDEGVRRLAERYTDQIVPFAWRQDFSAARNAGLCRASGEWFLYLDDDEWFEDVSEICGFFLSGEYRGYSSASYVQRNYTDWSGTRFRDFPALRMAKRVPGLRFENPIHEELLTEDGAVKRLGAYVHHYGYVKAPGEGAQGKSLRNIALLEEDVKRRPSYLKNYLQLAKEYYAEADWERAEEWCRKGRALCGSDPGIPAVRWLQVYFARILCKQERKLRAYEELRRLLDRERPCELVRLIVCDLLVHLCAEQGLYEEALEYSLEFDRLLEAAERKPGLLEGQRAGDVSREDVERPGVQDRRRLNSVLSALELGREELARDLLLRLPWEEEQRMREYYPLFERWKRAYGPVMSRLLAGLPYEAPYLLAQRAAGDGEEARKAYDAAVQEAEDPYLACLLLREGFLRKRDFGPLLRRLDLDTWKDCAKACVEELSVEELLPLREAWEPFAKSDPLQWLWVRRLAAHKELTEGYGGKEALVRGLEEYASSVLKFYRTLWRDEWLSGEAESLLSGEYHFARTVQEMLERLSQGALPEAVRLCGTAAAQYPPLAGVLRELMRQVRAEAEQPQRPVGAEFDALAAQMKAAVRGLLEQGRHEEAVPVIGQLMQLLPGDWELLRLRQRALRGQ